MEELTELFKPVDHSNKTADYVIFKLDATGYMSKVHQVNNYEEAVKYCKLGALQTHREYRIYRVATIIEPVIHQPRVYDIVHEAKDNG